MRLSRASSQEKRTGLIRSKDGLHAQSRDLIKSKPWGYFEAIFVAEINGLGSALVITIWCISISDFTFLWFCSSENPLACRMHASIGLQASTRYTSIYPKGKQHQWISQHEVHRTFSLLTLGLLSFRNPLEWRQVPRNATYERFRDMEQLSGGEKTVAALAFK